MAKERATLRLGNGSANHNDRSVLSSEENVTSHDKTKANIVLAFDEKGKPERLRSGQGLLQEKEKEFYQRRFGASLERKNAHYKKKGNKTAIKTMDEYYAAHQPKEMVLQIGKGHAHSKQELLFAINEFADKLDTLENFDLLSVAIHCDESAMHAHLRFVIENNTDKGDIEVNQSEGLRKMGFDAKEKFDAEKYKEKHSEIDFTKSAGKKKLKEAKSYHERFDNPLVAFTDDIRSKWYDTLQEQGYDIERTTDPKNRSRRNKKTQEYKQEQLAKKNSDLEFQNERLEKRQEYIYAETAVEDENSAIEWIRQQGLLDKYLSDYRAQNELTDSIEEDIEIEL